MDYMCTRDGKKYFKKECGNPNCHRLIHSKGGKGLAPKDYLDEFCTVCYRKHLERLNVWHDKNQVKEYNAKKVSSNETSQSSTSQRNGDSNSGRSGTSTNQGRETKL